MGARPIPEGAARIVWPATLSDDGLTAGFFRHGQPLPWQASNESLEYVKSSEYWRILHHAAVAPPDFLFENQNAAGKECTGDMINSDVGISKPSYRLNLSRMPNTCSAAGWLTNHLIRRKKHG